MSGTLNEKVKSKDETMDTVQNEKVADCNLEKCKIKAFQWFYERNFDRFFQFVRANSEKSVQVRCLQCPPTKSLNVTANTAFNLNSHFKVSSPGNVICKYQFISNFFACSAFLVRAQSNV